MGAKYVRDVYPGEIVEITKEGFHTVSIMGRPYNRPQAFCIFEYVYFARPDSIYEGKNLICSLIIVFIFYLIFNVIFPYCVEDNHYL